MRSTLLHDRAIKLSKAKVHVYSDSVLNHMDSKDYQEIDGIDGEPVEFEWNISPGHTKLGLLHEFQRKMAENRIKPEKFQDRIIFMSLGRKKKKISLTHTDSRETMVIPRTRNGRQMVWNAQLQAQRFVETALQK